MLDITGFDLIVILEVLWMYVSPKDPKEAELVLSKACSFNKKEALEAIKSSKIDMLCNRNINIKIIDDNTIDTSGYDEINVMSAMEVIEGVSKFRMKK